MRVGQGVDVHAFATDPGRALVLGGVLIPDGPGLEGHSDADVVLHALVDALLGAAGLGDIGTLFGSDDPAYAGADSQRFLAGALQHVVMAGWAVGNVDCTIVAQRPQLSPWRKNVSDNVARLLGVPEAAANCKVTSTDGLGFIGRGEGIACVAVTLLHPSNDPGRQGGRSA